MCKVSTKYALVLQLMLGSMTTLVTSVHHLPIVVNYRRSRQSESSQVTCALQQSNLTVAPASLLQCSVHCSRDEGCQSFNMKQSDTCDLFNYRATIMAPVDGCENYQKTETDKDIDCRQIADDAQSIPAECCALPYTLNGRLFHNCSIKPPGAELGCYDNGGHWVTCLRPDGNVAFEAKYEETSTTALSADPAVSVPLLTINGWILMQRKVTEGLVSFDQDWAAYRDGFGSAADEDNYWLGLDKLYRLMQLSKIKLRAEVGKYRLTVDGYSGDAGNALMTSARPASIANGNMFSTPDSDNDMNVAYEGGNCAATRGEGWWFAGCSRSDLNVGRWSVGDETNDVEFSRMLVKTG